ncbi:mucin-5AC-like isoform X2 [Aphis gossypii]|uniref:mucin-5AC-like isoform X2 n=1 Tax=Aphis gossypii TaxID=80765 RepID=UPI0021598B88|nr:mucin-5AC-like isoform X2 [Aphis gossypii]
MSIESNSQFEAIRTYLKELDVIENVWIGLKRNSEASEFTWTNYQPLARSGYFREEVPRSSEPVCVVTDPTANFKWHSLHCGGPEVASFVCELPVPYWASKTNGCMTSMMEGMTVTFLPERPAIQLTKECSPGVSKNVTCKGNMKQSEINEKLSCPNSNKPLKTLFKPVKPELADIKLKTTTSSSESDVEDYAIEMATIAQYNDETFQSISKVMGRSSGSIINLPQEMSIAQEPIKSSGRGGFDTNGIDSAFIGGQVETTSTGASSISISTSTSTNTISSVSSTSMVTNSSTTSTSSTTPKSVPKTTSKFTIKQMTTTTPIEITTETSTLAGLVTLVTTSGTTTNANTVNKATTSPVKITTTGRIVTTVGGTLTGGSQPTETSATTPTTTISNNHHHQHQRGYSTNTTSTNANANSHATTTTTTTTMPKTQPTTKMTTTEKIHTVAKMFTAETGDDRRATDNSRRPTAATLAAIATVVSKIPYTVASVSATTTSTTGRPLNSLRSYINYDNRYAAKVNDAPTIEPPIRVYKKIDFPELPINNSDDNVPKPTATPFSRTSVTTFSSPINATKTGNNNMVTTRSSTRPTVTSSTTINASVKPTDALNNSTYAATETATTNTVSGMSPTAVAFDQSDDDIHNWNLISSSSSLPEKTTGDDVSVTSASVTPFDITSSATDIAAVNVATETTTVAAAITTTAKTSAASTTTFAATTATAANHRKIANYDAYTDHPNRSRHIVRPKQQHHHSYPYILYRLLG